jgi:hypothetical protein
MAGRVHGRPPNGNPPAAHPGPPPKEHPDVRDHHLHPPHPDRRRPTRHQLTTRLAGAIRARHPARTESVDMETSQTPLIIQTTRRDRAAPIAGGAASLGRALDDPLTGLPNRTLVITMPAPPALALEAEGTCRGRPLARSTVRRACGRLVTDGVRDAASLGGPREDVVAGECLIVSDSRPGIGNLVLAARDESSASSESQAALHERVEGGAVTGNAQLAVDAGDVE